MPKAAVDTKGLTNEQILNAYKTMITSRMVEDKCAIILRQSKGGTFQISGPGHEAALVAGSLVMRPGHDWSLCHYRDLTYVLGLGVTTEEIFTGFMAREGDPARVADYQIWCGPAQGAFNEWVAGTFLEDIANRTVAQIAWNLLEGAARISRAAQLRAAGAAVPPTAFSYVPQRFDEAGAD